MAGLLLALAPMLEMPLVRAFTNLGWATEAILTACLWAGLVVLTNFGLAVLSRYAPSRDAAEWAWAPSGTLAGLTVLPMWFWMSAFKIPLGAKLDAKLGTHAPLQQKI